jgi:hypothetical protein
MTTVVSGLSVITVLNDLIDWLFFFGGVRSAYH